VHVSPSHIHLHHICASGSSRASSRFRLNLTADICGNFFRKTIDAAAFACSDLARVWRMRCGMSLAVSVSAGSPFVPVQSSHSIRGLSVRPQKQRNVP